MGTQCQVCNSPERARIELGLANRVPPRALAKRYGLHRDAIWRHGKNHMPPALKAALQRSLRPEQVDLDQLKRSESEGLMQHLVGQRGRLYALLDTCEEIGDTKAAVGTHGAITKNLSLTARLLGELQTGSQTTVNMLVTSPQYVELRAGLIRALHPFPQARRAVSAVLKDLEGEAPHITGTPLALQHEANDVRA